MATPLAQLTGYIHPTSLPPASRYKRVEIPAILPWQFDWRDIPGGLTPIKDQGQCGSCWAFGTTAVLEQAIRIKTGQSVILSEQELVSCSDYGSCSGGDFAHGYQESPHQSTAAEFPYVARDASCKQTLSHNWSIKNWAYVGDSGRSPTVDEIKAAILQYGVVAVTVYANSDMQRYKSGVFDSCENGQTNHIVALVGWNDEDGAWIMRNSWGADWGEKGYMRIKYNCSNVGEQATYVEY
jgi:C1A family cysteine protease